MYHRTAAVVIALTSLAAAPAPPAWDTFADTWVATDGLGRTLPTAARVGPPKPHHTVGIFYYLWLPADDQTHAGPFDNSRILAQDPDVLNHPDSPLLGHKSGFQHWGQPLLGYYRMTDPYVLRKHAQQLSDAGVDVVLFDTTNSYNYFGQVDALADAWLGLRRLGQRTPQIVFTCRPGKGDRQAKQVRLIYDHVYREERFAPLVFRWDGKPLILADADPARMGPEVSAYFTFRDVLWAKQQPRPGMWSLDNSLPYSDGNDRLGLDDHGRMEEMAAAVAVSNAGGPMSTLPPVNSRAWRGRQRGGHLETDPDAIARGGQFQDEFDFLLARDPQFCLVYCWNEWVAQKFVTPDGRRAFFVDEFDPGHSKDVEPMAGGFGDDYLYQMPANLRRYRGVRTVPPVTSAPITIDGNFDDWAAVTPEFRDTVGDAADRDWPAFGDRVPRYVNHTGRNDLKSAKVSLVGDRVCFLIRTAGPLIRPTDPAADPDWMTLYLDADHDPKTGWLGYDLRVSPGRRVVERNVGGRYVWADPTPVDVAVGPDGLELSLPRSLLRSTTVDFKWTDRCYARGDWTDFTLNGDAAPNDRYNFRAILR